MTTIIRMIHDPSSQTLDQLFDALGQGKLCIFDISQMRGANSLVLSGLILQKIFEHNQSEFTKAEPQSIPTIAVVEEAQSVLGNTSGNEGPYITWVKEGRKFGLGALLITQQPGSISNEILSQGDNWFIFHLISSGDLAAVKHANAHFSNDLLSSLLNEPIPGNGVFWSSTGGKPYPIPMRVLSFEKLYKVIDPEYNSRPAKTYGAILKEKYAQELQKVKEKIASVEIVIEDESDKNLDSSIDIMEMYIQSAFQQVSGNKKLMGKLDKNEVHWMLLQTTIKEALPINLQDLDKIAYESVPRFMDKRYGEKGWHTKRKPSKSEEGKTTPYFIIDKQ